MAKEKTVSPEIQVDSLRMGTDNVTFVFPENTTSTEMKILATAEELTFEFGPDCWVMSVDGKINVKVPNYDPLEGTEVARVFPFFKD